MAHITADRVRETSTTTGTGTYTLAGAVNGFRAFSAVMSTSDTCYYFATMGGGWEIGRGTLASATTLARTEILASSNGGSAVNWGSGAKDVCLGVPAWWFENHNHDGRYPRYDAAQTLDTAAKSQLLHNVRRLLEIKSSGFTVTAADIGKTFYCEGTFTVAFAAVATLGSGFRCSFIKEDSAVVTLDPNGSEPIDSRTTRTLLRGQSFDVVAGTGGLITIGRQTTVTLGQTEVTGTPAAIDFTLPPGFVAYKLIVDRATFGGATNMILRLSTDGGSSFVASAGAYAYALQVPAGATTELFDRGTDTVIYVSAATSSDTPVSGEIAIFNARTATARTQVTALMTGQRSEVALGTQIFSGARLAAEDNNAVRLLHPSGWTGGQITFIGVAP